MVRMISSLIRSSVVIGAFFMLAAWSGLSAAAQDDGAVIKGRVLNKTGGETPVTFGEARLRKFVDDAPREDIAARVDEGGNYEFKGLSTGETETYYVLYKYKDVEHFTGPLKFEGDDKEETADIAVYETTDKPGDISVAMHHIVIDFTDARTLNVKEILLFANESDLTYIGAEEVEPGFRETLRFSQPAGATEFKEEQGIFSAFYRNVGGVIVDSMPVFPGQRQVVYSYSLKADGQSFNFKRRLDYPVPEFSLMVADKGAKVDVSALKSEGQSQGEAAQQFLHFTGKDLKKGAGIEARFTELGSGMTSFYWILIALLSLPVAASIGVPLIIRRGRARRGEAPDPERPVDPAKELERERKKLIAAIAALDDRHDAGTVDDTEYKKVRSQKKQKLIEVTGTLTELEE